MMNKEELKEFYLSVIEIIGEKIELQYRIDKAIEYIEHNGIIDLNGYDLLDILKGRDKND